MRPTNDPEANAPQDTTGPAHGAAPAHAGSRPRRGPTHAGVRPRRGYSSSPLPDLFHGTETPRIPPRAGGALNIRRVRRERRRPVDPAPKGPDFAPGRV